ncbi:hypothetical protein AGDE_00849 [Angomonas deanei]|nr:hypothetical protein AGDE_00849 [Angomonas deanei]|eukprot:EPY43074.1 hypothetical protein AGDE_00849 [Angomonas deanei]
MHRLRRSGMTFNKPRGRDTLSLAFESRVRLVPFLSPSDLYGPLDVNLLLSAVENYKDPTSSLGNPLLQKKEAEGNARWREVQEKKRMEERQLLEKRTWHVLVADPISKEAVEEPISFPSVHPTYYSGPPAELFEQRILREESLPAIEGAVDDSSNNNNNTENNVSCTYYYPPTVRNRMRQNGDSSLLAGAYSRTDRLSLPQTFVDRFQKSHMDIQQRFRVAACIDPFIDVSQYQREEAQVEMISAYRNILYEAAELGMESSTTPVRRGTTISKDYYTADVLRIPALCVHSCGTRFYHDLGKLNQQALLKGFHRLSNEAKEKLILNRSFSVELFVPAVLFEQFEPVFLEEAWETPTSVLNPGRFALYPGLAPPRSLLELDGWVGKRPELVEAVETKGKSLMSGHRYNLDGTLIQEEEVYATMRIFGTDESKQKRIEGERRTAAAQLGEVAEEKDGETTDEKEKNPQTPSYPPLHAGLQNDKA